MSYNKVYEVYRKNPSTFPMAVAYLIDKGYEFTKQITDEDIVKLEGNGLMTKEFVQELVRTAREITEATDNNAVEIIQFCAAEKIFDTQYYTGNFEDDEWGDEEVNEGIVIPNDATNGDVIKMMFPKADIFIDKTFKNCICVIVWFKNSNVSHTFSWGWWNTLYKKGV